MMDEGRELGCRLQEHHRAWWDTVQRVKSCQTAGPKRFRSRGITERSRAVDGSRSTKIIGGSFWVVKNSCLVGLHVHVAERSFQGNLQLRSAQCLQFSALNLVQQGNSRGFGVKGHGQY